MVNLVFADDDGRNLPVIVEVVKVVEYAEVVGSSIRDRGSLNAGLMKQDVGQHRTDLRDQGAGVGGCRERVEVHEVVDRALVAGANGGDAGFGEFAGVGLGFVAERVVFGGDDEGGREALELVGGKAEGSDEGV